MHKQRKEEWEMLKGHLNAQEDTFKKLCMTVQAKQMKELEAFFAKYIFSGSDKSYKIIVVRFEITEFVCELKNSHAFAQRLFIGL